MQDCDDSGKGPSCDATRAVGGIDIPFTAARITETPSGNNVLELLVNGQWLPVRSTGDDASPRWLEAHGFIALTPPLAEMMDDIRILARNPWADQEMTPRRLSGVTDDPAVVYLWQRMLDALDQHLPWGQDWTKIGALQRDFTPEEVQAALAERAKGRRSLFPRVPRDPTEHASGQVVLVIDESAPSQPTGPAPPRARKSPGGPVKPGVKKPLGEVKPGGKRPRKGCTDAGASPGVDRDRPGDLRVGARRRYRRAGALRRRRGAPMLEALPILPETPHSHDRPRSRVSIPPNPYRASACDV